MSFRWFSVRPGTVLAMIAALGATTSAYPEPIILDQANGDSIRLDQPAEQLITLSPHLAELVFDAGAGDKLLASVEYSNYPDPVQDLPRVGDAFRIDAERIMALSPDLVIAWESGNPSAALNQLRSLGITVWSVEIREPLEIAETIEQIGQAANTGPAASVAANSFRHRLDQLSRRFRDAPDRSFFYQADETPLFTLAGNHLVSKGMALCGGENIFASVSGLAVQVSHEAVIAADPDAIFAPYVAGQPEPLTHWKRWTSMSAVSNEALYLLPADKVSRATPRWLDSIELACNLLHGSPNQGE